jgi:hypothetical protein
MKVRFCIGALLLAGAVLMTACSSTVDDNPPPEDETYLLSGCIQGKPLTLTNQVSTLAGSAGLTGSVDGTGTVARFDHPFKVATDGDNLYLSDYGNNTIRKIVIATGVVTTLAGSAGQAGFTDGTGAAARFNGPAGITTDGTYLYVADYNNHTIRRIVIATGAVTTIAGSPGMIGSVDDTGAAARFNLPEGLCMDHTNLYVSDTENYTVRKIVIASGVVTTLAGSPGQSGSVDGTGAAARIGYPEEVSTEGTNVFFPDSVNHTIRKIAIATGTVTTIAGSAGLTGSTDATGSAARFNRPIGIATDGTNLYIADADNYTVRKLVLATNAVTTLAGSPLLWGSSDGTGAAARFDYPSGCSTDGVKLFVTDHRNATIRSIR